MKHAGPIQRGFVATECAAIIMVCAVFLGTLLATTGESRRLAMLNRDLANMRQIGAWTFAYANDHADRHPSFSSAPNTQWPDLRPLASSPPPRPAVGQAVDIIRRLTGRHSFPMPSGWFPHILYTHLVLADYAQLQLPDTRFVSTGDKHRLNWLDDPINKHDQGFWQPYQNPQFGTGPVQSSHKRWPYSASFQTPPAWYDQGEDSRRLWQSSHSNYSIISAALGAMQLSDVAFPSQKVMLHDYGAWHFTKQPQYFAHETARVPILMADGGSSPRQTADSNDGWNTYDTTGSRAMVFTYYPRQWEPPAIVPHGDRVTGHYRWTRGGIKGRDFDGPEINTGQK